MEMPLEKTIPVRPIPESYWVIPDRFLAGEYPTTPHAPEFTRKRLGSFLQAGFNTFINLTGIGETECYEKALREAAKPHSTKIEYLRFPIVDFDLPKVEAMKATLDAIDAAVSGGRKLYVHCYGGIGRTGTVIGCYLVRHGRTGAEALAQLGNWWRSVPKSGRYPHSPETIKQEQFILNWVEANKV